MESSKKSALPSRADSDVDVDEFARQFFGTDQDYNRAMPPKSLPIHHQEKHQGRPEENFRKEKTPGAPKDKKIDNHISRGPKVNHNQEFSERSRNINGFRGKRVPRSVQALPAKDSKQVILTRFLELREEFYSLSERLESVNMPKISKRLTRVLAERQKLMVMLLEMGGLSNDGSSYSKDDEKVEYERRRNQPRYSNRRGFGMPKKSKSVHWSDDCLGGSITQDPALREPGKPASLQARLNNSRNRPDYSDDSEYSSQTPWSRRQLPKHQVHQSHEEKMPPAYKMVDFFTPTRRRHKSPNHECDAQGSLCSQEIGHALECIEEIVNEAAALRREACCMLWRAHYLEQICDADGIVNNVYHAASHLPVLPRYPH